MYSLASRRSKRAVTFDKEANVGMTLWSSVVWVVGACALGFATTAVFSTWLRLSRNLFLIPYVVLASIFLIGFFTLNGIDVAALLAANWIWGVVVGVVLAVFLIRNVQSQPATRKSKGAHLVFEIIWAGLIYGLIDGIYLSVMPVVAIWEATGGLPWAATLAGKVAVGAICLFASLMVSVTYHLGYKEFRNRKIRFTVFGPGLMTLGVLISGSPLAAIISHPAMHIAAVLRGPETTIQLPPHQAPVDSMVGARS
jgi:hypothetical protein